MGSAFAHYLTSPIGVGVEIVMLGLLVAVVQLDWQKHLGGADVRDHNKPK